MCGAATGESAHPTHKVGWDKQGKRTWVKQVAMLIGESARPRLRAAVLYCDQAELARLPQSALQRAPADAGFVRDLIEIECGSPILPLHKNRLLPECPKVTFLLGINLYPWCLIF